MLVQDQIGRQLRIPQFPKRIISLVPSQTELLFDLGLEQEIVGITKFCIHPQEKVKSIAKVGGTKNFRVAHIAALQPDLIIANKEENYLEGIRQLETKYPVWISDIYNLSDALAMIQSIGAITNRTSQAEELNKKISSAFCNLLQPSTKRSIAYLIWKNPYMAAASKTFIDAMITQIGFTNIFSDKERYPEIDIAELSQRKPNYIFLSSEPYPFREKHIAELQMACPDSKVILVNGEMFSWYGSRLLKSAEYFQDLLATLA